MRYNYYTADEKMKAVYENFTVLAGDKVGPSHTEWHYLAYLTAKLLRELADLYQTAGEHRSSDRPVVFPPPSEFVGE